MEVVQEKRVTPLETHIKAGKLRSALVHARSSFVTRQWAVNSQFDRYVFHHSLTHSLVIRGALRLSLCVVNTTTATTWPAVYRISYCQM